jgi:hypothetical protein
MPNIQIDIDAQLSKCKQITKYSAINGAMNVVWEETP